MVKRPAGAPVLDPTDERDVNGAMVEPLRHRQTKGAATATFYLMPPRHISTLHQTDMPGQADDVCS
jgi:hypothetical protein